MTNSISLAYLRLARRFVQNLELTEPYQERVARIEQELAALLKDVERSDATHAFEKSAASA